MSEKLTITNADRDAAYPYANFHCLPDRQMHERWYAGYYDNLPQGAAIRDFARHRIDVQFLLQALKAAVKAIEDDRGLDESICCSGYMCGCQGSSHRQLLLHDLSAIIAQTESKAL
jgi:hypothetical protein